MERTQLNIGLFGFGCVGEGLYRALERTPTLKASIKKICIKHAQKERSLENRVFTCDRNEIFSDASINVIVELIDDADAAFEIVATALRSGRAVVSANKKMLAEHFEELLALQRDTGKQLLYEASCCASIPLIRNLEEYYDNDLLGGLEGIINGSTNYILDRMESAGIDFAAALKEAQTEGYAESDPTLDIEGHDARNKLVILIAHAFGSVVEPTEVYCQGISKLGPVEMAYAKEKALKLKLIAKAGKTETGKLFAYVMPAFVSADSRLAQVDDAYNGVNLQSSFSESQFFLGKGAGAFPTASAVLSDLSALSYNYRYEYRKLQAKQVFASDEELFFEVFWRCSTGVTTAGVYFNEVREWHRNSEGVYIIGNISLKKLRVLQESYPTGIAVLKELHPKTKQATLFDLDVIDFAEIGN